MTGMMIALLLGTLAAQARPDFAGTWIEDPGRRFNLLTNEPMVPAAAPAGGAGVLTVLETIVEHTATTLRIERRSSRGSTVYAFNLDGSPSTNHNGAETMISRSRWEGKKLVTEGSRTSVTSQGESTWQYREIVYLDPGGAMVIEATHTRDGTVSGSTRRVYTRKPK